MIEIDNPKIESEKNGHRAHSHAHMLTCTGFKNCHECND